MNLSDIYHLKANELAKFTRSRDKAELNRDKDYYIMKALDAERTAGTIAHCIAMFGDMPAVDFLKEYKWECLKKDGTYRNPWRDGYFETKDIISSNGNHPTD